MAKKKRKGAGETDRGEPRAAKSGTTSRGTAASPDSVGDLLDRMLPLLQPVATEAHVGAAVLQVGEPTQLLELVSDPAIAPYLLCRLAPDVALVEPGRAAQLTEILRRRGHTPKVEKLREPS